MLFCSVYPFGSSERTPPLPHDSHGLRNSRSLFPVIERKIFVRRLNFEAFEQSFSEEIHLKISYESGEVPFSLPLCCIRCEVGSKALKFSISDFQMPCGSCTRSGRISDRRRPLFV